jgi:predicted nucleic acid-binding protein
MAFFVDANVILYAATEGPYRAACASLLEAVAAGRADGRTSPVVLEEVWHVERSGRAGSLSGITADAYTTFTPLIDVTDEAFRIALSVRSGALGTADRLHVGTCRVHGIDTIVTADGRFDAVRGLRRVDPLDAVTVRGLLGEV